MKIIHRGLLAFLTLLAVKSVAGSLASDWPVYRHDVALSGVSPGKGQIAAPEIKWEHYLGSPFVGLATDRHPEPSDQADLDGDGSTEKFSLSGKTMTVTRLSGEKVFGPIHLSTHETASCRFVCPVCCTHILDRGPSISV